MLKGWQIAKINASRKKKPYKQMQDRDMTNVELIFSEHGDEYNRTYHLQEIKQPEKIKRQITEHYIANLGQTTVGKYWTHHGWGGWITFVEMNVEHFNRMKSEVERLGGKIIIEKRSWFKTFFII